MTQECGAVQVGRLELEKDGGNVASHLSKTQRADTARSNVWGPNG